MKTIKVIGIVATAIGSGAVVYEPTIDLSDVPNRIPEAAPYVVSEAQSFGPPFEEYWRTQNHPGQCKTCHAKIFDEWNGSMMSNAWRDPVWRAAFLLLSRAVSTHGECDTPQPPDGTKKASHNPFAKPGACASSFDIGAGRYTVSRPGSLLDAFCSRCHMPTNYIDNVPLKNVKVDPLTGIESARVDPGFNPTSDDGTGLAFATLASQFRNTDSGKAGVFCAVCHTFAATRDTPFHNYARSGAEYAAAEGTAPRAELLGAHEDMFANGVDPCDETRSRGQASRLGQGARDAGHAPDPPFSRAPRARSPERSSLRRRDRRQLARNGYVCPLQGRCGRLAPGRRAVLLQRAPPRTSRRHRSPRRGRAASDPRGRRRVARERGAANRVRARLS